MTAIEAIAAAETLLPGQASGERERDPRWQAIIEVAEFIPSHPDEVWKFAARWGCSEDPDLRAAIGTCLVEHLLERHFELVFPRVEKLARADRRFAATLGLCWEFGHSSARPHAAKLRQLQGQLRD